MTVGRKQFSKVLLDQLPKGVVLEWSSVYGNCSFEEAERGGLSRFISGSIWGWVSAPVHKYDKFNQCSSRWIIFEDKGRLSKHRDLDAASLEFDIDAWNQDERMHLMNIYRFRNKIVGFRPEDQLFFGI